MQDFFTVKSLYQSGQINRRDFLKGPSALGVGASTLSLGLGAARVAPKQGGTFRLGTAGGSTTDTLIPGTLNDDGGRLVSWAFRSSLTELDETGKLTGDLAESWDVTPDAKTWTIMLRKGVTFHSGKTVDADDVVASFNLHRGKDSKSSAKSLLEQAAEIKADGKDKVVFKLKGGNADFAVVLSDYNLVVLPSKDGSVDPTSKDGTGCYVLENYDPGVRASLKRDPNAWKADRGHFDAAEITYIGDVNARINALRGKSMDVVNRVDLKTVSMLKRVPGIKVEEVTGTQHYTIPMLTDVAPFKDNNVRLALKHAINRRELVDKIIFGHGLIPTTSRSHRPTAITPRTFRNATMMSIRRSSISKRPVSRLSRCSSRPPMPPLPAALTPPCSTALPPPRRASRSMS